MYLKHFIVLFVNEEMFRSCAHKFGKKKMEKMLQQLRVTEIFLLLFPTSLFSKKYTAHRR